MPVFQIGERQFDYTLRRSPTAKKANITVTPQSFELLVPEIATEAQIQAVLHRRRAWILKTVQNMQERARAQTRVYRFVSGAKIPYRGRMMKLTIEPFDGNLVEVSFRNGFLIRKPTELPPDSADVVIESALRLWLKRRVREDAKELVRKHGERNGLKARGIQIKDQKHMWGSCGQDRQIHLNWHLIFAPRPVFEYAVVHELCHLKHRNHEPEFWQLVGSILPDWQSRKDWLDKNEHMLGWEKVGPVTSPLT
ncbi:metal-dependent hydrolase [Agrobacterium sp. 13-626]|uniref:M48 family metallopeptidase n=1 Tax=Rhizobium rhizogenes TaxID=359 RepID=UPI00080FE96C|nr:SprT family zinc-dependent metalloprotease [Rhizobium rhizogenes]NTI75989.1 M48 family metallopeptidase [Rhizobium rhizogenes]OCI91447.1 metal-dependent hydrolase [Agrobacterium sp. 13-626]